MAEHSNDVCFRKDNRDKSKPVGLHQAEKLLQSQKNHHKKNKDRLSNGRRSLHPYIRQGTNN